jgi:hypothetical protein
MKDGGRVWSCSECYWIHRPEVAKELLAEFKALGIDNVDDIKRRREELKELFLRLKDKYPPAKWMED